MPETILEIYFATDDFLFGRINSEFLPKEWFLTIIPWILFGPYFIVSLTKKKILSIFRLESGRSSTDHYSQSFKRTSACLDFCSNFLESQNQITPKRFKVWIQIYSTLNNFKTRKNEIENIKNIIEIKLPGLRERMGVKS